MKIKPSRNGENTLSFTDIDNSCTSCGFLKSQICLLTLFVKTNFSQKFLNLQYSCVKLRATRLSPSYTFTILATAELRLTPIYQVVMHRHES